MHRNLDKPLLTIFTPSYNRAHTLTRTYESLCNQSSKDFLWLIIDDGSTDGTKDLVDNWIKEKKIDIQYIYQQNQGMHGAHNTAYRNIKTELNTCIDSDDWMPENAVELIISSWKNNKNPKSAGLIGLDQFANGKIIGTPFPSQLQETKLSEFYDRGGKGDKKLVYRTDIIKQTPEYPLFENEKYYGLAYKYWFVDQKFTLKIINQPLVTVEYQADGSSHSMYKQYWNNPRGFAHYRMEEMKFTHSMKRKFLLCIHYVAHNITAGNKGFVKNSSHPILVALAFLPGYLWYRRIKYKVKNNKNFSFNSK